MRLLECWKAGNTDQVGSQLSKLGLEKVKPKIVLQKMLKIRPLEMTFKNFGFVIKFPILLSPFRPQPRPLDGFTYPGVRVPTWLHCELVT